MSKKKYIRTSFLVATIAIVSAMLFTAFSPCINKVDWGYRVVNLSPEAWIKTDSGLVQLDTIKSVVVTDSNAKIERIRLEVRYKLVKTNSSTYELTYYDESFTVYTAACFKGNDSTFIFHGRYSGNSPKSSNILQSGNYVNGYEQGEWYWYNNRRLQVTMETYHKGIRHGAFWKKYDDGKIMYKGEFRNGVKCSRWIHYYENGCIESDGKFSSHPIVINESPRAIDSINAINKLDGVSFPIVIDVKIGTWKYWDANCKLLRVEQYDKNGKLTSP